MIIQELYMAAQISHLIFEGTINCEPAWSYRMQSDYVIVADEFIGAGMMVM